ncbi:MAG TPA: protein kinase [Povalibacter sp.]
MDKNAALSRLGLTGGEDAVVVTRAYGQRLATVQEKLVSAQTDVERLQHQTALSTLVEAYEFLTETGRYTRAPLDDSSATMMRDPTSPPPAPVHDTLVRMETGAVLSSRLEIGELLGQGGMGYVYAARDRLRNEDVAIKVLRQDLIFSTAAKERFLAEAKMSSNLSHPNIVRVYDVGEAGGHYYLSMERLKGHTLRHRIEAHHRDHRDFSAAEVTDVARQLVDALRYAHRYIVHRDLKPENVWLADDGTVKLMDFGIARAYSNSHMTQTGMTLGTAYYMAPEQRLDAKEVDWRADQYALGVVMYELLAGTIPMGAVKPLDKVRRDIPLRYANAVMRAMSPRPDDRWPSLNEFLAEIEAPQRSGSKAALWLILGIGAIGAAAAGVYYSGVLTKEPPASQAASVAPAITPADIPPTSVPAASDSQQPPASPPTAAPEITQAAPAQVAEQNVVPAAAQPVVEEPRPEPVVKQAAPVKAAVVDNSAADRRRECVAQCERDDGECRSINRRGKQECMKAVGFGATGGFTSAPGSRATADCAFYGQARCSYAADRDACLSRMSSRYSECVSALGGNVAARRQDCDSNAREADSLCLDQLRECRSYCQ